MKIAIQLFPLRNEIDQQGLGKILNDIKETGVQAVEVCGRQGLAPEQFCKTIMESGLEVCGAHIMPHDLTAKNVEGMSIVDYMSALNCKDIVIPWVGSEMFGDNYAEGLALIKGLVDEYTSLGFNVSYHNHNHEFDGEDVLQKLKQDVPKLTFELDLYFVAEKNIDICQYKDMFDGRIKYFHFKELSKDGADCPNPFLGEGLSKCDVAKKYALQNNMEYAIIEYNDKICTTYKEYIANAVKFLAK